MDETNAIIKVWCDGGCRNNQKKDNIGAWAYIITYKNKRTENYGATYNTSNSKMELLGCIMALSIIKKRENPVIVTSDSSYLVKGVTEWSKKWIENGWLKSNKKPVENKNIWLALLEITGTYKDLHFILCKGHSDNLENNRCDELVNIAMDEFEE